MKPAAGSGQQAAGQQPGICGFRFQPERVCRLPAARCPLPAARLPGSGIRPDALDMPEPRFPGPEAFGRPHSTRARRLRHQTDLTFLPLGLNICALRLAARDWRPRSSRGGQSQIAVRKSQIIRGDFDEVPHPGADSARHYLRQRVFGCQRAERRREGRAGPHPDRLAQQRRPARLLLCRRQISSASSATTRNRRWAAPCTSKSWCPSRSARRIPIVFLHGAGQTGVDWLQTPDGRPGWAYNFLDMGYVVYLQDFPARGRSQYVPGVDGTPDRLNLNIRTAPNLEEIFTASAARGDFPQAKKHTQWPGTGRIGDKIFDDFAKTQVQFLAGDRAGDADARCQRRAARHDQHAGHPADAFAGRRVWLAGRRRAAEPGEGDRDRSSRRRRRSGASTPPRWPTTTGGGLSWGVANSPIAYEPAVATPSELQTVLETQAPAAGKVPCYVQQEPARKLKNLQNIPVLLPDRRGQLSPHLRPLPREVAEPGRREDRVRRDGERRADAATAT